MKIINFLKSFFKNQSVAKGESELTLEDLTQTQPILKKAYLTVGLSFLVFILWAVIVPLDEGVPVMGTVAVDTKPKIVQHFQGGVIKHVYVKEGDFVKEGDLLIKLGDLVATANYAYEKNKLDKLTSLERELKATIPLVKEGYLPQVRQYELERDVAELRSTVERLKASKDELVKTEIRSPADGQVIGIAAQTVGGVIQGGQKIMEVVPQGEQLIIELKIPPHLIDRVKKGDEVDLRFFGFANTPMLVVTGVINSVSTATLNDPTANPANPMGLASYYLARVSVTKEGLAKLQGRQMMSGMDVGGVVKTGSRTLLQYVLAPLTKRIAFSMKEE